MKIIVTGDFCPQKRVAELFDKDEYKTVLDDVKQIISDTDYSIVNFECPVADDSTTAIRKQGPSLRCSEKGVESVKWLGFDCVTLANNHFLDQGAKGVDNTLAACKRYEIDTVGGGRDLKEAANILYKDIEGKKLAIINC
jgi:poly-gamma-glutamate synthesis protein (capsule biosynthesis protein)